MDEYAREHHQKLVREKLNSEKVKLWLPPYTTESKEKGEMPEGLVSRYAQELHMSEADMRGLLEALRLHALQKLAERDKFQKAGIATMKVKVAGSHASGVNRKQALSIEISLEKNGNDFRQLLSEKCDIPMNQIKLISSGRVVTDTPTLREQNLKNGSQVMLVRLSVSEAEAQKEQEEVSNVARMREAAELLSSRVENEVGDYDIQIADQSGRSLTLPIEERKALTLAMTLHEKGRAALKKREITQALLILLEADKEFSKCHADLLNAVDNYAVLCLDIVWCYLCLKNVEELPDADHRLRTSETCFIRSYGANNERLTAVKGGTGSEQAQALFMRLHLLQGIVAFHQHKPVEAVRLLNKAEEELKNLQVDVEKINQVLLMGFSDREARLGLRACRGNVEQAVDHIMNRRKEKDEVNKKNKEDRKKEQLSKQLGKTANGEWVNVHNYHMLTGTMGFPKGAAAEALKQANNDISLALEVLQTHPELLNIPDPDVDKVEITDEMMAQLTSIGFDIEMAKRALAKHNGNVQRAAEELVQSGGFLPPNIGELFPSTSTNIQSAGSSPVKTPEELQKEKEAIDSLVSDMSPDEEDYLDLTLQEEAQFLSEYRALLASISGV